LVGFKQIFSIPDTFKNPFLIKSLILKELTVALLLEEFPQQKFFKKQKNKA